MRHVIVAGAGLAGLCAARTLADAGVAVTIVEARDRPGGRVWTLRDGLRDGQHAELGGEFIDADHEAIRGLARELGVELVRVLASGFTHRFRCERRGWCLGRTSPWNQLRKSFKPLLTKYAAADENLRAAAIRQLSTISVRDWLRQRGASDSLHSIAEGLRGFFLADPDDLSVLPLVELLAKGGSPAQGGVSRVVGGSDRFVDALIAACPAPLLRHVLRKIGHDERRVMASVEDERGRLTQIEADSIVIALPASTLADVEIDPPLPERHATAIRRLRYGCATKVILQSPDDIFGRRHVRAFGTDTAVGAFWDGAEEQAGSHTIVTFLGGGSASRQLRQLAEQGSGALLSEMCWLRANPRRGPLALAWTTWEDDPWARGGYAYFDPGFDPADRPLLARRVGPLVFAGEHTSETWQGYMNGAVESGLRAARQLIRNSH
jgi:monoamine oxidase